MPVVGEAHIMVRALTTRVAKDIKDGFDGIDGATATKAGETIGQRLRDGFSKSTSGNWAGKWADGLRAVAPGAEAARDQMNQLIKQGYKFSAIGTLLVGSIGTIIGALGALIGAAGGAAAAFTAIIGTMVSLKVGMAVAKFALKGVGEAVGAATQAQTGYNDALAEARKQLKQLKFDAEAAALAEEGAALSLEKAIENLNMTADLPPNSQARRAAVLAYKEADLAYRRAQERNKEAQKEAKKTLSELAKGSKQDPFAGLTKTQKKFAKFLVTLQPIFKKLRESVAKGFLGPLQKGLDDFIKSGTFTELKNGIIDVGAAL